MPRTNYFAELRRANIQNLCDFVNHVGARNICWKCGGDLKYDDANTTGTCTKCGNEHRMLKTKAIIAQYAIKTGATEKTIISYLDTLENAGRIDYVTAKDSYRVV